MLTPLSVKKIELSSHKRPSRQGATPHDDSSDTTNIMENTLAAMGKKPDFVIGGSKEAETGDNNVVAV